MTTTLDPALQAAADRLRQLEIAVQSAQRLAQDWNNVANEYRAKNDALARELARLRQSAQALSDSRSRPLGYTDEVVLVSRALLNDLCKVLQ